MFKFNLYQYIDIVLGTNCISIELALAKSLTYILRYMVIEYDFLYKV